MSHNNYFQFKQFTVIQSLAAMRVGTDGVLLGAWASVDGVSSILDIGTGTGVIALMLAQRSGALVDAVDLEEGAVADARLNFANAPWNDRLSVYHTSLQEFPFLKQYDCIVCNPPYFNHSLPSQSKKRSMARHAGSLPFGELIENAAKRLHPNGHFSVVLPAEAEDNFRELAKNDGLFARRITRVSSRPFSRAVRVLLEFRFNCRLEEERELALETGKRHELTQESTNLLKDYYLHL